MSAGLRPAQTLNVAFFEQVKLIRASVTVRVYVAPSEKFRRVMEAYQIEMDYGRTLEAYSGLHTVDGQERDVDFLRVGRTAFIFQTRDGSSLGIWNK